MITTQYIPDLFKAIVAKVAIEVGFPVRFDYGHYGEICRNISFKDESVTMQGDKYPLVWLVMDFEEIAGRNPSVYAEISPMIIIAAGTSDQYTMDERRDNTFLPILYPIYGSLLNQFSRSKEFFMPNRNRIVHKKEDMPYWDGGKDKSGANMFNDYIDAIWIKSISLSVKQNCIIQ